MHVTMDEKSTCASISRRIRWATIVSIEQRKEVEMVNIVRIDNIVNIVNIVNKKRNNSIN